MMQKLEQQFKQSLYVFAYDCINEITSKCHFILQSRQNLNEYIVVADCLLVEV